MCYYRWITSSVYCCSESVLHIISGSARYIFALHGGLSFVLAFFFTVTRLRRFILGWQ